MTKVFIDGKAGTTGLRIFDRLAQREEIEIMSLSEERRKDPEARREMLNACDVAFLCLPDAAAIEAVSMIDNPSVTVIDASTAHRTNPAWAYGFPELSEAHEKKLLSSKRIAVPGCHASGFISLVYPLIEQGVLDRSAILSAHSLTGYSGGGKSMIADYEADELDALLRAPRQYGIAQKHKHLPEMKAVTGLENAPLFCPIVSDFYSGMEVTVPLHASMLKNGVTMADIASILRAKYTGPIVTYRDSVDEGGFISAAHMQYKDSMEITVCGNDERMLLVAVYDNLGKGASGAAIQCMNMILGIDKTTGLVL